jgi:hypothetical protein
VNQDVDLRVVTGAAKDADGGVEHGALLRRLAHAILGTGDLEGARSEALEVLGERKTVHASQIVAAFDGINRVADVAGIRTDPEMGERASETVATLGIASMESA